MLEILKYVLWIGAVLAFIASGYFVKVLQGLLGLVTDANTYFWVNLPAEFQAIVLGFIAVLIFLLIRVLTKD